MKEVYLVSMARTAVGSFGGSLKSIPAVEQISKEIASDQTGVQAAAAAVKTAEEKMAEKVSKVVGENFEFRTLK